MRNSNGLAAAANSNVVNGKVSEETKMSEEIGTTDQLLLDTLGSGKIGVFWYLFFSKYSKYTFIAL